MQTSKKTTRSTTPKYSETEYGQRAAFILNTLTAGAKPSARGLAQMMEAEFNSASPIPVPSVRRTISTLRTQYGFNIRTDWSGRYQLAL